MFDDHAEEVIEIGTRPLAKLWTAGVMWLGLALLCAAALVIVAEMFVSLRQPLVEALVTARVR